MLNHPLNAKIYHSGAFIIRSPNETECTLTAQQLCQINPWRTLEYTPNKLQNYLLSKDPCLRCLIIINALNNEIPEIIGICCVRFPWLLGANLELFAIFPAFQQLGIGAKILIWLEQELVPHTKNLWILVSAFNKTAQNFYAKHGYSTVTQIEGLIKNGFDEILLRKILINNNI